MKIHLKDITTRTELAAALNVDIKAIGLITLSSTTCRNKNCNLPAALHNNTYCIVHSQTWFPRTTTAKGKKSKNSRGHGLYGRKYMSVYNGVEQKKTCCCENDLCNKIGYSHEGMFHPPYHEKDCKEALWVLGITSKEARDEIAANPNNYHIAPWHYHNYHRKMGDDGKWVLRESIAPDGKYRDNEKKPFGYPPPNASVQNYINAEIPLDYPRGGYDDTLPSWYRKFALMQREEEEKSNDAAKTLHATPKRSKGNKAQKITPSPRRARKRTSPESAELEEMKQVARELQAKLDSALEHIKELNAVVELKEGENIQIRLENNKLREENSELRRMIDMLEQQKAIISYDSLKEGGILGNYVNDFTWFANKACNDAFLDLINWTEGCEDGDGLCQNLVRYDKVSMEKRKEYNGIGISDNDDTPSASGEGEDDMSVGSDAGTGLSEIADRMAVDGDDDSEGSPKLGRNRKLGWKDEYLVYCFYARCNISMRRVAALFGIGSTLVHNIVCAWANVLCDTLEKFFPVPTRSEILRAYPKSVLKKFGHANIFMLLDATEAFADIASMKTVNAILYSAYKHNSTVKWLVGCDPIGTVWNESISDGYPGSISDPIATAVSEILDQIPFACAVEVDKGFLIENECALLGIICIRPMKMLDKQTQQSAEDTALTQKVGKTRIPIEQANGQMKRGTAFFDRKIRIDQIGLADLIFRSSYLLTNFNLPFIQERHVAEESEDGRPCSAEIRYYGGTDEGLVDVRPYVELWGMDIEIPRWHTLRQNPIYEHFSDTEISELLLAEDWPGKMKKEHLAALNSNVY